MLAVWYAGLSKQEEDAPASGRAARAKALSALGRRIVRLFFARQGLPPPVFARAEGGKPYIPGAALFFNVSHSKNLVCAAFGDAEVGIDIEYIRPRAPNITRVFTPEERAFIAAGDDPRRAFFNVWTRKEAFLKALGTGWRGGGAAENTTRSCVLYDERRWHIRPLTLTDGYAGAVCSPLCEPCAITALANEELGM